MNNRERQILARREMRKPVTNFEPVGLAKASFIPKGMTRAFRNTRYIVMVYDNCPTSMGFAIRAMVQKHDNTRLAHHWKEMQAIKNELFGEETTAVEYYPAESNLEDNFNIYWMWIFPNGDLPIPV